MISYNYYMKNLKKKKISLVTIGIFKTLRKTNESFLNLYS